MLLYATSTSLMGMTNVPWMDIIGKCIPPMERARVFAVRRLVGGGLAMGAGVVISFVLSERSGLGFPTNYALLFGLSGVGTLLSVWTFSLIREPIEKVSPRTLPLGAYMLSGLRLLREDENYRRLCLLQFLWAFSMMAAPFYVPYAITDLGVGTAYVGVFVSVMQLSTMLSNVLWAWLGRREGNQALLIYGTYALALSILIPIVVVLFEDRTLELGGGMTVSLRVALYSLTFAFSGFATSGMYNGRMTYVLDIAPPERRPTYTSFMNTFMLPQGLLPVLAGVLVDWISYRGMFKIALLLIPPAVILARRLKAADLSTGQRD